MRVSISDITVPLPAVAVILLWAVLSRLVWSDNSHPHSADLPPQSKVKRHQCLSGVQVVRRGHQGLRFLYLDSYGASDRRQEPVLFEGALGSDTGVDRVDPLSLDHP